MNNRGLDWKQRCALRARVERPAANRYRLVGVGLAGFVEADQYAAQYELFG